MPGRLLTRLFTAALLALASCALPDDFVKVEAGPLGGPSCAAFTLEVPEACDPGLLADPENCCVTGRSCFGGECFDGECQPATLYQSNTEAIAVVPFGDYVVFTTGYGDQVLRVEKGGSAVLELFNGTNIEVSPAMFGAATTHLATDGNRIFFTTYNFDQVFSVDIEGDGPQSLADNQNNLAFWGRIAVDDQYVYWSSEHGEDGAVPALWYAPKGGGEARVVTDIGAVPNGVTVDATHLYWTDRVDSTVRRAPVSDVTTVPAPELLYEGESFDMGNLAVTANEVFWLEGGSLMAVGKDGSGLRTLFPGGAGDIAWTLALDGDYAYFTAETANQVIRVNRITEEADVIAEIDTPKGLAVDCDSVYVTTFPAAAGEARVLRLAK